MRACPVCDGLSPDDARYCIACSAALGLVVMTGPTQRLDTPPVRIASTGRQVFGILNGEMIFAYDPAVWCDPAFAPFCDPFAIPAMRRND